MNAMNAVETLSVGEIEAVNGGLAWYVIGAIVVLGAAALFVAAAAAGYYVTESDEVGQCKA
jgi:lactobin A/cerein 7B family class IIb bacteriocin